MSRRSVLFLSLFSLVTANDPLTALAQGPRRLADKPLAIMYAKEINAKSAATYVEGMSKRMGVGKTTSRQFQRQIEKVTVTKVRHPVVGQIIYLVQGLVPSLETISFQSVIDEEEAIAMIESQKRIMGDLATIETGVDGHYKLVRAWEHESELQPEQEVKEFSNERPGYSNKLEVIERDGKRFQIQSGSWTQQFRYHDRFLYSSQSEEFVDTRLPSSQEIHDSLDDDSDVGMKIYADRVPEGLRTLGWSMLSAMLNTQLQRQDAEGEESWQMRRSAGNWALSFLKSLMFDVDYGEGEGHLASGRQPIRGQFFLRPRRNSGFVKQLDELGSGRSRFAPLLRDDAGVSVHLCVGLPPEGQETLNALADWIIVEEDANSRVRTAVSDLVGILHDVSDEATLEVMARLVHSISSGSVLLGGVQVGDREDILNNMERGLRDTLGPELGFTVERVQRHGRPILRLQLPVDPDRAIRVSDIWIAHRDSCLWLAAGGENAHEMIRSAADRCAQSGRAIRARLLTAKLDMEHWMSWPKDDPTGMANLPNWMDSGDAVSVLMAWAPFGPEATAAPTPLLDKVMTAQGSKKAWVTLDAKKSGLSAEAELGAPLADWFLARQIDAQEQFMQQMKKRNEEAARKAAAAAANPQKSAEDE